MLRTTTLATLLLTACVSAPTATPEEKARALAFQPGPSESALYVYRHSSLAVGPGRSRIGIALDGRTVGETTDGVFLFFKIEPGKHSLNCYGENKHGLDIDAPAGGAVYVFQEMQGGFFSPRCRLEKETAHYAREEMQYLTLGR